MRHPGQLVHHVEEMTPPPQKIRTQTGPVPFRRRKKCDLSARISLFPQKNLCLF